MRFARKSSSKALALALALAFCGSAWADTSTLEQSVERAILSNPEVSAQFQDFQSSLEGQKVTRGRLLPEVNVQGWVGHEWRGSSRNSDSDDWGRRGYSLALRQLIFDGFSTINDVRQLGFEKLAGYYELLSTVDNLALQAAEAYLDVKRYREQADLARDNYAVHQDILSQISERSSSGVGRGVDEVQAQARLALAQTNYMTATGNLNEVLQRYQRVVGSPAPDDLQAPPSVSADLPADPQNFSDSIRMNPALLAKQALYQAANAGKASAQGHFSPTLELRAATGRDRDQPFGYVGRDAQASNVQLMMSFNLFRGGSDAARVRQTAAQAYAARDVRDYTCRNIQQELAIAWSNVVRLREQLPFLQEHETSIARVRVAYMQQFKIGQRSLLDLLDTENELFDARRALVNGTFDLAKAEYNWLAQSHKLLPALGLAQPYDEQPKEAAKLDFTEDILEACVKPVPDTTDLQPLRISYQDGMKPPVLSQPNKLAQAQ